LTPGRRLAGLVAGLFVLPLVACRADVQVRVTLTTAGRGTVAASLVLDHQAVATVGDRVDVSDLRREGWSVVGPVPSPNGSVTITVAHGFGGGAEAAALLARLGAPLHLSVSHHHGALSSWVGLHGVVDLRGGINDLGSSTAALPGGVAAALAAVARAGGTVPAFSAEVIAALPGRPSGVVGGGRLNGNTVTWAVPLGSESAIGVTSARTDTGAQRWLEAAAACLVALVVVVVTQAVLAARRSGAEAVTPTA
jgi:hypothetical protein